MRIVAIACWSLFFGVRIYFVFVFKLGWYRFANTHAQTYNTHSYFTAKTYYFKMVDKSGVVDMDQNA